MSKMSSIGLRKEPPKTTKWKKRSYTDPVKYRDFLNTRLTRVVASNARQRLVLFVSSALVLASNTRHFESQTGIVQHQKAVQLGAQPPSLPKWYAESPKFKRTLTTPTMGKNDDHRRSSDDTRFGSTKIESQNNWRRYQRWKFLHPQIFHRSVRLGEFSMSVDVTKGEDASNQGPPLVTKTANKRKPVLKFMWRSMHLV